jgi:hypothetical protein
MGWFVYECVGTPMIKEGLNAGKMPAPPGGGQKLHFEYMFV